jgi:hypothetical protein
LTISCHPQGDIIQRHKKATHGIYIYSAKNKMLKIMASIKMKCGYYCAMVVVIYRSQR